MECLMKKEEPSYSELIKTLEKNVAILKIENHYNSKISYELDVKLMYFHNVSRSLADKLESLWKLAETHQPTENEIKQFADQIAGLWTSINRQLQQLLCISNIMPRLIKLQSAIDKYVTTIELLPRRSFPAYDLSAFSLVAKLLTGELLGYESIDPSYVLMENMPKKPVFIIKNVKRKSIHPYYPT